MLSTDKPSQGLAKRTARSAFLQDWNLYIFEGAELAIFMISACVCTVLLFHPGSPAARVFPSAILRRSLMGAGMGLTAVLIIHSPIGKWSGAHFNPAITLTYLRLGKIAIWDAVFYVVFQFAGGVLGVGVSRLVLGKDLADSGADYAVTVPGRYGTAAAFAAEFFMAALLMGAVLWTSDRPHLARYTSYCVGILIALYIPFLAPVSGFSINPARTVGSAVFAHLWTAGWIYFAAPLAGMLGVAEAYVRSYGSDLFCAQNFILTRITLVPFVAIFPFIVIQALRSSERLCASCSLFLTERQSRIPRMFLPFRVLAAAGEAEVKRGLVCPQSPRLRLEESVRPALRCAIGHGVICTMILV